MGMPENNSPLLPDSDEGYYSHLLLLAMHDRLYRGFDTQGVCAGMAMSGIQAFLTSHDTFKRYESLLEFIGQNPNYFNDGTHDRVINEITQNRALARLQIIADLTANNQTIPPNLKVETVLSQEQQRAIDLMALFDNIELYHFPRRHRELFDRDISKQNIAEIAAIVQPKALAERGGFVTAGQCQGIYDTRELTDYMELLDKFAKSCNCDIALQFCSAEHMFAACFENATQSWTYIDANGLNDQPTNQADSLALLASYVSVGATLSVDATLSGFTTLVLVNESNQEKVKSQFEKLQSSAEFAKLHAITQENKNKRAFNKEGQGATLPFLAAFNGDVNTLSELIQAKSDMLHEPTSNCSPISIAMQSKAIDCVKALLEVKNDEGDFLIDINLPEGSGKTPVMDAIMLNNVEALKLFLEAREADGSPRLLLDDVPENLNLVSFAITYGNAACLKLLDEHGAYMFPPTDGFSMAEWVAESGEDVKEFYSALEIKNIVLGNAESHFQAGDIDDHQRDQMKNIILDAFKKDHTAFLKVEERTAIIHKVDAAIFEKSEPETYSDNIASKTDTETRQDSDEDDLLSTYPGLDSSGSDSDDADTDQQFDNIAGSTAALMRRLSIQPETIKNNLEKVAIDREPESTAPNEQHAQDSAKKDIAASIPEKSNDEIKRPKN
jgi:ankyrin repeat protein